MIAVIKAGAGVGAAAMSRLEVPADVLEDMDRRVGELLTEHGDSRRPWDHPEGPCWCAAANFNGEPHASHCVIIREGVKLTSYTLTAAGRRARAGQELPDGGPHDIGGDDGES